MNQLPREWRSPSILKPGGIPQKGERPWRRGLSWKWDDEENEGTVAIWIVSIKFDNSWKILMSFGPFDCLTTAIPCELWSYCKPWLWVFGVPLHQKKVAEVYRFMRYPGLKKGCWKRGWQRQRKTQIHSYLTDLTVLLASINYCMYTWCIWYMVFNM